MRSNLWFTSYNLLLVYSFITHLGWVKWIPVFTYFHIHNFYHKIIKSEIVHQLKVQWGFWNKLGECVLEEVRMYEPLGKGGGRFYDNLTRHLNDSKFRHPTNYCVLRKQGVNKLTIRPSAFPYNLEIIWYVINFHSAKKMYKNINN